MDIVVPLTQDTIVHHDAGMITREQLSQLLQEVDAKALADHAGVSVKTIYRLRAMKNAPRLDMVQKLLSAVKDLKRRK